MEKFSAVNFWSIGVLLAGARVNFDKFDGTKGIEAQADDSVAVSAHTKIKDRCDEIGLTVSSKCSGFAIERLKSGDATVEEFRQLLSELERTIRWEMEDRLFMYIPPARAHRYDQREAFGPEVAKNFSLSAFDITESGNCFASGRFTASVFHLMRVLEVGLVAFAGLFPNIPTSKENWQQIIEKIESEIREMPKAAVKSADWKEKQEKYSQIANNFMFFKDAWRNYTAHARGKYTEDESDAIYRNVRVFMQGLAAQGIKE
jgi:hypothetical protein